jgi:membrane-associated phospholipid phosphatase
MHFAPAILICALLASAPAPARAEKSPGPYVLGVQDYALVPLAAAFGIAGRIRYQGMTPVDTAMLDKQKDLWGMDRWAAGTHSRKAGLASDLAIYPLLALPMAVTVWESAQGRQTWDGAVADAVIYAEAMILSSGLDLVVRSLQIHARPLVYDSRLPADERLTGEASGSFYSGHSNGAFLSATYFSYTYSLRNPGSKAQPWIWAGTLGAASAIAGLRIAAGKHFLSDVLVGAAAGAGFGLLFPWLHRRERGGVTPEVGIGASGRQAYPVFSWRF